MFRVGRLLPGVIDLLSVLHPEALVVGVVCRGQVALQDDGRQRGGRHPVRHLGWRGEDHLVRGIDPGLCKRQEGVWVGGGVGGGGMISWTQS